MWFIYTGNMVWVVIVCADGIRPCSRHRPRHRPQHRPSIGLRTGHAMPGQARPDLYRRCVYTGEASRHEHDNAIRLNELWLWHAPKYIVCMRGTYMRCHGFCTQQTAQSGNLWMEGQAIPYNIHNALLYIYILKNWKCLSTYLRQYRRV